MLFSLSELQMNLHVTDTKHRAKIKQKPATSDICEQKSHSKHFQIKYLCEQKYSCNKTYRKCDFPHRCFLCARIEKSKGVLVSEA